MASIALPPPAADAKFPVFGVMEAGYQGQELVLSFARCFRQDAGAPELTLWHKEKIQKCAPTSALHAVVPDTLDARCFTVYFNDGTAPWTFWCAAVEHCVAVGELLKECCGGMPPSSLTEGSRDQMFCNTWVEKKGKVKWARRWVALVGCRLLCFRNEGMAPKGRKPPSEVPLNIIPITGTENVSRHRTTCALHGMTITIRTFREYQFKFKTKAEAAQWMQALAQAGERQQTLSDTAVLQTPKAVRGGADPAPARSTSMPHPVTLP